MIERATPTLMLNARVPTTTFDQVTAEARYREMSRSDAIREALALWLDFTTDEPCPSCGSTDRVRHRWGTRCKECHDVSGPGGEA